MDDLARKFGSLRSLMVFECAARNASFSSAAKAFNISQPSVSRNIAQLEQQLGLDLFTRGVGGATLTDAGCELFAAVRQGLERISETIGRLEQRGKDEAHVVSLSVSSSFVSHWMAPRLAEFSQRFPEVRLRFDLISGMMSDLPEDTDLATRVVDTSPTGRSMRDFAPEIIIPVCSPEYLHQHDVDGNQVILHLSEHPHSIWNDIMLHRGVGIRSADAWHEFNDYSVILQAALNGTGVALGWLSVTSRLLLEGRLVPAGKHVTRTGRMHRLIGRPAADERAVVGEIADWLIAGMRQDIDDLAHILA